MPDWFYVSQGQAVGPKNAAEIHHLLNAGAVDHDTLVWRRADALDKLWKTVKAQSITTRWSGGEGSTTGRTCEPSPS